MAHNVGEEIVGEYLQVIRGCEFVQYNVYTREAQGEIDVLGVSFARREVFVCEVAVHLTTGLLYVSSGKTDTVQRFLKKFNKDIDYAEKAFADFERRYMLWSPIVRSSKPGVKYDQLKAVEEVRDQMKASRGVEIEFVINEDFASALSELRAYAADRTEELKSPLLRLMQIEAYLARHCGRRKARSSRTA